MVFVVFIIIYVDVQSEDVSWYTRFLKYRLDTEAKGSTVFRIPEDVYKT